jgi:hypothetical protein
MNRVGSRPQGIWASWAERGLTVNSSGLLPMALAAVVPMELALVNRSVAVGTVWLIALAIFMHVRSARQRESALSRELQVALRSAHTERSAFSDWLHTQIDTELEVIAWRLNVLAHRQGRKGFDSTSEALMLQRAVQRTYACVREQEGRLRRSMNR